MGYYNSILKLQNGQLTYMGSSDGSDTPCYFDEVKTHKDLDAAIQTLSESNAFWGPTKAFPFPWKSFKTNDNNILAVVEKKKWYQKSERVSIYISEKVDAEDGDHNSDMLSFIPIDKVSDFQQHYEDETPITPELLKLAIKIKLFATK